MASRVIPVDPFDFVVFGGTGDLAKRKIIPGLYRRFHAGQMPEEGRIIAAARSKHSDKEFRKIAADAIDEFVEKDDHDDDHIKAFLERISYVSIDAEEETGWKALAKKLRDDVVRAFYFSVAPSLFGTLAEKLYENGLTNEKARIVVEKPFGHDLGSARELNRALSQYFDETQIYRIDHYLGKETVQNLMAVRFGNILFEPLWNAQYIDHVQITVSETMGVAGRGSYYDRAGAMRDMVQNHLMQLLCLTAMEPPSKFEPDAVRDEKLKVINALKTVSPDALVRGQYRAGNNTKSYKEDVENEHSTTESFIALRVDIENWRWNGAPFYLRTGKRMKTTLSEIVVRFREPPHSIFDDDSGIAANELAIRLQPNEGMDLMTTIKEPGPGGMRLVQVPLDMTYADALGPQKNPVDAYERLIMDVMRGNQTLFMRGDEVEAAWAWTDPIIEGWEKRGDEPEGYEPGSFGPMEALALIHRDGRRWREIKE